MSDLGPTLRTWRDRLTPAAAGLPVRHSRRAAGLRREELADLAGVSVDYVVRIEQGRAASPSPAVVAALARALQLSTAERDHLYTLAGLAAPGDGQVSDHVPAGVQRLVHRLHESAVAVFAADWQLVSWNSGWSGLLGDPARVPVAQRNFARHTFPVGAGAGMGSHPVVSSDHCRVEAAVVADLRGATARYPRDPRLARLVRDLGDDPRFAELWAAGAVGVHGEDHKIVRHPVVGPVTVDCDVLTAGGADLKVVVMSAAPGSADETRLRRAVLSGATGPTVPGATGTDEIAVAGSST